MRYQSDNKSILGIMFLCVFLFTLSLCPTANAFYAVAAGKANVPKKGEPHPLIEMLSRSGAPSIRADGLDEARQEAIGRAKEAVMLRAAALYVNSEILSNEWENLLRVFRPHQGEIIEQWKVISETRGRDGYYRVELSASIREDKIKSLLLENLYDDRAIVITSERNMGQYLKRHILEHELLSRVREKGYQIVDYRTVRDDTVRNLISAIRRGDTESVKKIGLYYLTDIVVVGYMESAFGYVKQEVHSAQTSGQVKIHQVGSRTELVSLTEHNVRGFGSDEERAGIDALEKLSPMIAHEAVEVLPQKAVREIKLTISQIGCYTSFVKARRMIGGIPYIQDVRDGRKDLDAEETVMYVRTTKSADYIASKISELKKFVIKTVGDDEIYLEARKI